MKLDRFEFEGEVTVDVDGDECIYLPREMTLGINKEKGTPTVKVVVKVNIIPPFVSGGPG